MTASPPPSQRLRDGLLIWVVWTGLGLFYFSQTLYPLRIDHDPTRGWHPPLSSLVG